MKSYSRSQYTDDRLLSTFDTRLSLDLDNTADLLADLAEIDARKLYVPAAYSSMFDFCVQAKHMSEDVALKRIRIARTAREFPAIFPMLADGRLGLSAVLMLATHLTPVMADGLLTAAAHRTNAQIELLLAERFPKPDVATCVRELAPAAEVTPGPDAPTLQLAVRPVVPSDGLNVAVRTEPLLARRKPVPLSAGKYAVQFTMDEDMHGDLLAVQALLGHVLPSGDVAEVFRRSLHELRKSLEKQKFAMCDRPRQQRGVAKGRHIPAAVKRAVRERDGDQCTFVSDKGRRCESPTRLELDHIEPIARGGESTVGNLRLRCRVHNQFEAECMFGPEFMSGKREQARGSAAQAKANAAAKASAEAKAQAAAGAKAIAEAKAQAAAEAASQKEGARPFGWTIKGGVRGVAYEGSRAQAEARDWSRPSSASQGGRVMDGPTERSPHTQPLALPDVQRQPHRQETPQRKNRGASG